MCSKVHTQLICFTRQIFPLLTSIHILGTNFDSSAFVLNLLMYVQVLTWFIATAASLQELQ
jgi:hypothetical protein